MSHHIRGNLDERYRSSPAYLAGHLPKDRRHLDDWHRELRAETAEAPPLRAAAPAGGGDAVDAMAELIRRDGIVRMYVTQMIDQQPEGHVVVESVEGLIAALRKIVGMAPTYDPDPDKVNAFPMSRLFAYMMMTPAGEALFRLPTFNTALAAVLKQWCAYLDSPESAHVLTEEENGWLSRSAYFYNRLWEFDIPNMRAPHWGWTSYNDFFHREINLANRPVAAPDDPKVVVSANDGSVYNIGQNAQRSTQFWLKGQRYSLEDMLDGSHVDRFVGGSVFQSFLSGANYHRWRSPIAGTVREARVVNGLMFSDAEDAGPDPTAGTYSQFYETAVNTRALVFIESPDPNIGMVCVIPIGITEISSVTINVEVGQELKKGDELGWFSYGGSAMALVFQPGAIDRFTVPNRSGGDDPDSGPPIRVNQQIAVAR
jgi:phosphatidylserine decarboxylase